MEEIIEMIIMKEVGGGLQKDSLQIMPEGMTEVVAVDLDSGSRATTNRDRIRC